jgi:hypothetical protein
MPHVTYERLQYLRKIHTRARNIRQHREWVQCLVLQLMQKQRHVTKLECYPVWEMSLKCCRVYSVLFFRSGTRVWTFVGVSTLEHATYSCPCEKHGFCMWISEIFMDCFWTLLIDIANARWTGNCSLLKSNGKPVGISGVHGMNTSFPLTQPVRIVASSMWEYSSHRCNCNSLFAFFLSH